LKDILVNNIHAFYLPVCLRSIILAKWARSTIYAFQRLSQRCTTPFS